MKHQKLINLKKPLSPPEIGKKFFSAKLLFSHEMLGASAHRHPFPVFHGILEKNEKRDIARLGIEP
jgi:hypothetical protein